MEQSHRMKIFSKFSQSIKPLIVKEKLELLHQRYYIREFKIWEIDAAIANNLYFGIITRTKRNPIEKNQFRWVQNQLRLFVWTLSFYSFSKDMDIKDMTNEDWDFFVTLFPNKEKILFEYQASNLLKNHNQYKKWVHEEDELFEQLVKRDKFRLRWSDLGKALYIESGRKYFRTAKQCRERWLNHLDPSKLKKYWLQSEDFTLIEYVKYNGKKWASISKKLNSKRNEHSIKNRFKSLLTRESKLYLQPRSEKELIDAIYIKLLKEMGKKQDKKQEKSMKSQNIDEYEESFELQGDENYEENNFEQEKPFDEIYDEDLDQLAEKKKEKDILGNISLNSVSKEEEKHLKGNSSADGQAFGLTKINIGDASNQRQEKKERQPPNEMEKRIRADLFLQQDPFELLKNYFYKEEN